MHALQAGGLVYVTSEAGKGFEHGVFVCAMQSQRRWRCSGGGSHGGQRV